MPRYIHIAEVASTNTYLAGTAAVLPGGTVIYTSRQTAGRGQKGNSWESEPGKNLTFSMLLKRPPVAPQRQFAISEAVSVAIVDVLNTLGDGFAIKWPNDIYWRDGKIGGILIENTLQGNSVKDCIIGIGLNVNQRVFLSNAPNPVSLWQISEQETDCEQLLHDILEAFQDYLGKYNKDEYLSMLYRRKGFHPYSDKDGPFMAELVDVEDSGHLLLRDDDGKERRYAFKEVTFIQ